jgi:molybdopterin-guanine dinucleotide biosynthesis protein MobB
MRAGAPYIVAVQGLKNSGKTTVAEALIASLSARGYRTGSVKLTGHARLDLDARGTDTHRHAEAGAEFVLARSAEETFLLRLRPADPEPLFALAAREAQFVICEGCRDPGVDSTVLCLRSPTEIEETLKQRGLKREQVIAFSGSGAGSAAQTGQKAILPWFDVRLAGEREALVDLIVAAAGGPRPAGAAAGPLSLDPDWQPGEAH